MDDELLLTRNWALVAVNIFLEVVGRTCDVDCLLWRFTCFDKWSDRINRREHTEQLNFFSPVWVLLCLESSSDLENLLSQPGHWHENGFSPVIRKKKIALSLEVQITHKNEQNQEKAVGFWRLLANIGLSPLSPFLLEVVGEVIKVRASGGQSSSLE